MILKQLPPDVNDTRYMVYRQTKSGMYKLLGSFEERSAVTNYILASYYSKLSLFVEVVRSDDLISKKLDLAQWMMYTKGGYEPDRWETLF